MSHPLIYTTVESATSAYNSSKNFSPRFKSGAEYVEGYLTPLANTVGNISRVTGVEGSVRWFLSGSAARRKQQQPADLEAGTGGEGASHKRRKVEPASAGEDEKHLKDLIKAPPAVFDAYAPAHPRDRRLSTTSSIDTLPVYDDSRSPAYEAVATAGDVKMTDAPAPQREGGQVANVPQQPQAWQARLVMSTSGLSIAMSEESLRSLKYCLSWLRWANDHMATAIGKLKTTIEQYDRSEAAAAAAAAAASSTNGDALLRPQSGGHDEEKQPLTASRDPQNPTPAQQPSQPEPDRTALVGFMVALRDDLMRTLKETIDTVSRYAGGALPENASTLVRRHLTSLPQRFRLAALREQELREQQQQHQRQQQGSCDTPGATMLPGRSSGDFQRRKDKEVRDAAQRVVLLAKEAVDMMAQVSGVLDGTIQSAEEWCDRQGRSKRRREGEGEPERDAGGQSGGAMTAAPVGGEGERRDGDVNMS